MNSNEEDLNKELEDTNVQLKDQEVNDATETNVNSETEKSENLNGTENFQKDTTLLLTENKFYNSQYWRVIPSFYPGNYHQNNSVIEAYDHQQSADPNQINPDAYMSHFQQPHENQVHYDSFNYPNMNYSHYINHQYHNFTNNMVDYNMACVSQNLIPHQIQFSINYNHNIPNLTYENQKQNYKTHSSQNSFDYMENNIKQKQRPGHSVQINDSCHSFYSSKYYSSNDYNNNNYLIKPAPFRPNNRYDFQRTPNNSNKNFQSKEKKYSESSGESAEVKSTESKRYSDIGSGPNSEENNNNESTSTTSSRPESNSNKPNTKYNNKNIYNYNHSFINNQPFNSGPYYDDCMYRQNQFNNDPYYISQSNMPAMLNKMMDMSLESTFYSHNYYNIHPYDTRKFKSHKNQNNFYNKKSFNINNFNCDHYDPNNFLINNELEGARTSRFFVIKSYSKEDIIKSIKYNIWCSTQNGNSKLDKAFTEIQSDKTSSIYLFFSVNGSGQFCGMAEMLSRVDYEAKSKIWTQDKWNGTFSVKWIFVKDVPNIKLRQILVKNNENKPVTNSRDTQEIFFDDAYQVLNILRQHVRRSSILDELGNHGVKP